ncbi:MAG: class I SAM-dependent methyltransferase [Pseudomonadota bacterium]
MGDDDYALDRAYEIDGPDEAKALYRDWAATYDSSFGEGWGYIAPREIARIYQSMTGENEPILDIGAGTGLVAEHLDGQVVDGLDITPEMLDIAAEKKIYRQTITADLLKTLPLDDGTYGGVISSGTFTHGHVGPTCLPELLRVTRSGALFVCGCIPTVFDKAGFGSYLALLNAQNAIGDLSFRDISIYEGKDHPHAQDRGLVMIFRKR